MCLGEYVQGVRRGMRDWVLSQEGDKWTVRMDVRDLGVHLDTSRRSWFSTVSARVRLVIFRSAILSAWRSKVLADLCAWSGSRCGFLLDIRGSRQLFVSSHAREREKALLRCVMVGGVWNGFLLVKIRGEVVSCPFCGGTDGDGHLFWDCLYLLLILRFVKMLENSMSPMPHSLSHDNRKHSQPRKHELAL